MKKLMVMLLAALMTLGISVTAFAENPENGKLTITNAVPDQEYSIYRIFDLESYNAAADAYVYKVNSDWTGFINQNSIKGKYVNLDDNGYVSWVKNADAAAFAKEALAYAKAEATKIQPTSKKTAGKATEGEKTVNLKFDNLVLGYYLVDSNVGTLCSLSTTSPTVDVRDKNEQPTIEKKVKDASDWKDENSVQIGDTVEFKTTITAQAGAQNYTLHDKMDDGLTFSETLADNQKNISVYFIKNGASAESPVNENNYTVKSGDKVSDGCTFHVEFNQSFCDTLSKNDKLVVYYSAVLNGNADVIQGENNEVQLKYGEKNDLETIPDTTVTKTFQFQIIKTDDTEKEKKYNVLEGAVFSLYTQKTGGNAIKFVQEKNADGNLIETYHIAAPEELKNDSIEKITEIPAGTPILKGLKKGAKYYLEEVQAPNGYNKLDSRTEVTLTGNNLAGNNAITIVSGDRVYDSSVGGGVQIMNSKGDKLPNTGGIGTAIFYVLGVILVAVAGSALIMMNRRRGSDKR